MAFWVCLLALVLPGSIALAQDDGEGSGVSAITVYALAKDNSPVYGVFDLGMKPSVRVLFPNASGGKMRFQIHGRHYVGPVPKGFNVLLGFEDVAGKTFAQSKPVTFLPEKQSTSAVWFKDLDGLAGLFGSASFEVQVPAGTAVINVMGDDPEMTASPNHLMGYLSHIELTAAPR